MSFLALEKLVGRMRCVKEDLMEKMVEDGCFERGLQNRDQIFLRQNTVTDTGESANNDGDMTKKAEKTWLSF